MGKRRTQESPGETCRKSMLSNVMQCKPFLALQGRDAEAESLYERLQSMKEDILGPDHLEVAQLLRNRAMSMCKQAREVE